MPAFHYLLKILAKARLLHYFNFFVFYKRGGRKIIIPILRSLGLSHLAPSELWMCDLFRELLPLKHGGFLDIGVNLGQSLIKFRLVDDELTYVGFEPNSACIYYTQELIRANDFKNTLLVPVGLSDRTELACLQFYTDGITDSSASIVRGFRPGRKVLREQFVPCFAYSDIKTYIMKSQFAVVKVDVEGAELEVLNSIRDFLSNIRPFVLIEILPVYNIENKDRLSRQNAIEALLKEVEYSIFRIRTHRDEFLGLEAIESIGVNSDVENSDYVLCPREDVSKLSYAS